MPKTKKQTKKKSTKKTKSKSSRKPVTKKKKTAKKSPKKNATRAVKKQPRGEDVFPVNGEQDARCEGAMSSDAEPSESFGGEEDGW